MFRWVAVSWLVTAVVSYLVAGQTLDSVFEGFQRRTVSLPGYALLVLSVAVSLVLTWRWAWGRGRTAAQSDARPVSARRGFLLGAAGTLGGLALVPAAAVLRVLPWREPITQIFRVKPPYRADVSPPEWTGSRVVEKRRLGRTGVEVSDISIGTGSSTGGRQTVPVIREAIERGVNYFDTSPDYAEYGSEERIAEATQGVRDKLFLATKFCMPNGHVPVGSPVENFMEAVNGSLKRLRTDWVDLIHIHACNSVERLLDENLHEAFDRLKDQGKVRFLGFSSHTPNLEEVANAAIDSGRIDVMMLAYHHGIWPNLAAIVDRAAAADIGVVAMKTLRGGLHKGLDWSRDERDSFTQASFKWVLNNPSVSCLVISLWESGQLDEFLYASGKRPNSNDLAVLDRYAELTTATHCRPHCGICLDSCPENVPINDILRHRMYFEQFGAQKEAMRLYANLSINASACTGCSAPCLSSCPDGIPIAERTQQAHRLLTLG